MKNMIKLNTLNLVYCITGEKKYVNNYMRWMNIKEFYKKVGNLYIDAIIG